MSHIPKRKPLAIPTIEDMEPPAVQMMDIMTSDGKKLLRSARIVSGDWIDPDDSNPNRRDAKRVYGHRVMSVLVNLHKRSPREITEDHIKAARKLTVDWEMSEGARASSKPIERVDGDTGNYGPTKLQMDALRDFRQARRAMGPLGQYVLPIVLSSWTVEALAEACAMSIHRIHGRLASGLDILHAHYWPAKEVATIVPAAVLDAVMDPRVTDVAQERLGRWRR